MDPNPYGTPLDAATVPSKNSALFLPAILLIGLALFSAVIWILGGMMAMLNLAAQDPAYTTYGLIDIALGLANLAICGGSIAVLRGASRTVALTTAIAAMVPCISPCILLGLPLGIWMIVALREPRSRSP